MKPSLILTLDFGNVGYHDAKEHFRITLDADALLALIHDARRAWRVYELALIERPGDVWDYVMVTPEVVPEELVRRIDAARAVTKIPYVRDGISGHFPSPKQSQFPHGSDALLPVVEVEMGINRVEPAR